MLFQLQQRYSRSWVISNPSLWLSYNELTHHKLQSSLLHEAETLKLKNLLIITGWENRQGTVKAIFSVK